MERRGINPYTVAAAGPLKAPLLHAIVDGRGPITPRTALVLERALPGTSAKEWMALQAAFDLEEAAAKYDAQLREVQPAKLSREARRHSAQDQT